ncbi:MAG: hypothetical protein KF819_03455 [Labilithrix sp.]|nr:hypothetical protein [Labilithrix sp.]
MKIRVVFALVLSLAGCAADELRVPVPEAERARELAFRQAPVVRTVTSEEFLAEEEAAGRGVSNEYVGFMHDTYGRLGFFPPEHDMRGVRGSQAALVAAYYSSTTKQITLIGSPKEPVVVHELVHALQDEHFDLRGLYDQELSSDERMAIRGLVEGDATMAEYRHEVWAEGGEPTTTLARQITANDARRFSERVLDSVAGPAFFKAYPAFAYTFGAAFVANRLRIASGRWSTSEVDDTFRARPPSTTKEVLMGGATAFEPAPVGLAKLPPELAASHEVETVDRLGAWYTYLLFHPLLPFGGFERVAPNWEGDQLVVLRERDLSIPPKQGRERGVLWSSQWIMASAASEAGATLQRVHGAVHVPESDADVYLTIRGENILIAVADRTVVFVAGFSPEVMRILARGVLETKEEKRLRIFNAYAADPRVPCLR